MVGMSFVQGVHRGYENIAKATDMHSSAVIATPVHLLCVFSDSVRT